jgi:hypothetical protein
MLYFWILPIKIDITKIWFIFTCDIWTIKNISNISIIIHLSHDDGRSNVRFYVLVSIKVMKLCDLITLYLLQVDEGRLYLMFFPAS